VRLDPDPSFRPAERRQGCAGSSRPYLRDPNPGEAPTGDDAEVEPALGGWQKGVSHGGDFERGGEYLRQGARRLPGGGPQDLRGPLAPRRLRRRHRRGPGAGGAAICRLSVREVSAGVGRGRAAGQAFLSGPHGAPGAPAWRGSRTRPTSSPRAISPNSVAAAKVAPKPSPSAATPARRGAANAAGARKVLPRPT